MEPVCECSWHRDKEEITNLERRKKTRHGKGDLYRWDFAWTTGWAKGEKDQDKSHDQRPGQHHISVVHLEVCIKAKHFLLPWASLPFQLRGQAKARPARKGTLPHYDTSRGPPGKSSWNSPSRGGSSHVAVCAELEPAASSLMKHAQLFTLGACIKVIFCLTWRRAGNLVLK